jgi:hypothetical protein
MSDEFEDGKKEFVHLVKCLDGEVDLVIPVTPSRGNFLIALTKGKARKFVTVTEDDIVDLPADEEIRKKLTGEMKTAIAEMAVG